MKTSLAIAAGLLLVVSPVLARSHHKVRAPYGAGRGSVVTVGSSVRITDIGEVIGPTDAIISVSKAPPGGYQGRTDVKQTAAPAK